MMNNLYPGKYPNARRTNLAVLFLSGNDAKQSLSPADKTKTYNHLYFVFRNHFDAAFRRPGSVGSVVPVYQHGSFKSGINGLKLYQFHFPIGA